jgi:quercetin dioxygenase-like cupin family protein
VFTRHSPDDYQAPLPGIRMKTLCYGEKTLLTEFRLASGNDLPVHAHPYEQTGYLVAGHIVLTIGGEAHDAHPGDSWCIAGDVAHGARIIEDSVALEVFSPVREDYLPESAREG